MSNDKLAWSYWVNMIKADGKSIFMVFMFNSQLVLDICGKRVDSSSLSPI